MSLVRSIFLFLRSQIRQHRIEQSTNPSTYYRFFTVMWRHSKRAMNPNHGAGKCRARVLLPVVLILTISILLFFKKNEKPISSSALSEFKWSSFQSSVEFRPSTIRMNRTDVIWQIPDSPKAVLFIAHGCNGRALNFWDRSPGCLDCVGLPEERLMVLHALHRRYAVLTISSLGKCWSFGKEIKSVKGIISWWVNEHELEKFPIVALGASSGGYFVSSLATKMRFNSITLMIAEGVFDSMSIPADYPPTLFVHMPKDRVRVRLIKKNMESLKQKGVPVEEIRCMEFPLTPNLLSDRIPGLDQRFSVRLFELFREIGFIDDRGYMRNDGRATHWKEALEDMKSSLERYGLADHIQEELNLAFAYHEMTSLEMVNILGWYEDHNN